MHMPTHPVTGLSAIGWRKARPGENGDQPIWPIRGGSEDADDTGTDSGTDNADDTDGDAGTVEGEEALGDAGKRALDKMKADLRAERERRKAAERTLAERDTSTADGQADDGKPDLTALRTQALAQARAETLRDRALDRLEARAGRHLTDPSDARAHLAARVEEFVDGTGIDDAAIDDALAELVAAKPYLATSTGTKPRFEGTGDGGARKGSTGPTQLGKADAARMTPAQIVAAQKAGQFDDYLATET